jgi:DNA-binding CsgD family transcriptional regulator
MTRQLFTRSDVAAMLRVLDAVDTSSHHNGAATLLTRLCALVRADCGELSTWRQHGNHLLCASRTWHDPQGYAPAPAVVPSSERLGIGWIGEPEVRTWTLSSMPGWDGPILLSIRLGSSETLLVALRRARGDRDFTSRHVTMIDAIARSNGFLRAFTTPMPAVETVLPKRLREVLGALLRGQSEKQIATLLGISVNTVHVYVKSLHKRLGVTSRGELMSLWIGRPSPDALMYHQPVTGVSA